MLRTQQRLNRLEKSVQEATRRVRTQLNGTQWNDPVRKNFEDLLGNIERNARTIGQMSERRRPHAQVQRAADPSAYGAVASTLTLF